MHIPHAFDESLGIPMRNKFKVGDLITHKDKGVGIIVDVVNSIINQNAFYYKVLIGDKYFSVAETYLEKINENKKESKDD